jgi:hypothetical protein
MPLKMLNHKTVRTTIAFYTLCVTACVPTYYLPSVQHTPLFREKGASYLSGTIEGSRYPTTFAVQGAYAIGSHLGIGLNGNWVYANRNAAGTAGIKSNFGEATIGYFTSSANQKSVFEVYAGLGFGSIRNQFFGANGNSQGDSEVYLTRFGVQPAFGWRTKYVDLIVSSRLSFLKYDVQRVTFSSATNRWIEQADYLRNRIIPLVEPAFTIRVGGPQIKFMAQITSAVELVPSHQSFSYSKNMFYVGICVDLQKGFFIP